MSSRVLLGDVIDIIHGKNQRDVEVEHGTYPIYGSGGVMGRATQYLCPCNTVIIGRKGTINRPIFVDEPLWNVDTAFGLVADEKRLLPRYLFHFCCCYDFMELNTAATIPSLTKKSIQGIYIPLPSIDEQASICATLDSILNRREDEQSCTRAFNDLVKSRFVEMFGDPETNSANWPVRTFADICTVRQGLQIPISKRLKHWEEKCYEYITVAYIHGGKEREYIKDPKQSVICTRDDILMTRTGNTGMVITGVDGAFHNNFFLIDFDRTRFDKEFVVGYLNQPYVQADLLKRAGTSTIPDLNHTEFYKIKVYEPPLALQQEFAAFVQQVDKLKFVLPRKSFASLPLYCLTRISTERSLLAAVELASNWQSMIECSLTATVCCVDGCMIKVERRAGSIDFV